MRIKNLILLLASAVLIVVVSGQNYHKAAADYVKSAKVKVDDASKKVEKAYQQAKKQAQKSYHQAGLAEYFTKYAAVAKANLNTVYSWSVSSFEKLTGKDKKTFTDRILSGIKEFQSSKYLAITLVALIVVPVLLSMKKKKPVRVAPRSNLAQSTPRKGTPVKNSVNITSPQSATKNKAN